MARHGPAGWIPCRWREEEELNQNRSQTARKGGMVGGKQPTVLSSGGRREQWGQRGTVTLQTWQGRGHVRARGDDHPEKLMCLRNEGKGVRWEPGPKVPPQWSCSASMQSLGQGAEPDLCVSVSRRRRGGTWPQLRQQCQQRGEQI